MFVFVQVHKMTSCMCKTHVSVFCHHKIIFLCRPFVFLVFFCLSCPLFALYYLFVLYTFRWWSPKNVPIPEGDAYFTVKLQDYTAVEKDEVVLDCELSKDVDVMWYHNEAEIKPSKVVAIKAEGKRRTLIIKKVGDKDKGQYLCDCGTDKTTAVLHIEGKDAEFVLDFWYSPPIEATSWCPSSAYPSPALPPNNTSSPITYFFCSWSIYLLSSLLNYHLYVVSLVTTLAKMVENTTRVKRLTSKPWSNPNLRRESVL